MIAHLDFNIDNVLFKWKHKACVSLGKKVYLLDDVSFIIDVLLYWDESLLQKWTDPAKKVVTLFSEIEHMFVGLLINVHDCLYFEPKGKFV